jgi:hypothetical protein
MNYHFDPFYYDQAFVTPRKCCVCLEPATKIEANTQIVYPARVRCAREQRVQKMTQTEINFDICRNYHGGNKESVKANPETSRKLRDQRRILDYIHKQQLCGATCDEVEVALGLSHQTASARISELKKNKALMKQGTRPTRTGSGAGVYFTVGYVEESDEC